MPSRYERNVIVEGRLAFPALDKPRAFQQGADLKYEITVLIPKDSDSARTIIPPIQEAMGLTQPPVDAANVCLTDGDTKTYDGYAGCWALKAKSKKLPLIKGPQVQDVTPMDPEFPYAGCRIRAMVSIYLWDKPGTTKRVNCGLRGVQKIGDDTAFGSAGVKEDEWSFSDPTPAPALAQPYTPTPQPVLGGPTPYQGPPTVSSEHPVGPIPVYTNNPPQPGVPWNPNQS